MGKLNLCSGGTVNLVLEHGHTYLPFVPYIDEMIRIIDVVPVVTVCPNTIVSMRTHMLVSNQVILGPVVGIGAVSAVLSHCSILCQSVASLMVAGPPVVQHATHEKVKGSQPTYFSATRR